MTLLRVSLESAAPSDTIEMQPIGHVRGGRAEPIDDAWDAVEAVIELDPSRLGPDAAFGLDAFSHVEVIFHFDRARPGDVNTGSAAGRARRTAPTGRWWASWRSAPRTGRTASA